MDLEGLGPSLATLARCFRSSVLFCGAWNVPCEKAMCLHEDAVLMAIDSSTPSAPRRETACLGMRHLVMTSIDSRGFLLFFFDKSLKRKSLRFKKQQHKSTKWLGTQHSRLLVFMGCRHTKRCVFWVWTSSENVQVWRRLEKQWSEKSSLLLWWKFCKT